MADESFEERTQAPTPKKRRDAMDKGQVPRSQEVTTAFILLAGAGALAGVAGLTSRTIVEIFSLSVVSAGTPLVGANGAAAHLRALGWMTLRALAPIVLVLGATALLVGAVQARGVLTTQPLKPDWSRLDPIKKAGQLWGTRSLVEFLKSVLKLGILGAVVWWAVGGTAAEISRLGSVSPLFLLDVLQRDTIRILLSAGSAFLALALADYGYQVWQHEKQLKMTREEVKKELKESEGDQVVKVRRRTMARQLARRRMLLSVSTADVVVTNPTHIAIALKYDPDVAPAPIVLAMGERKVAERIKELAREAGVPTVENRPLARALLATAKVGMPIPVEFFVAVAEILAFVYRTRSGAGAYGRNR